jgi:hypothetical protein
MTRLARTMIAGAVAFTSLLGAACLAPETALRVRLAQISLIYPIAYAALSLWLGGIQRGRASR